MRTATELVARLRRRSPRELARLVEAAVLMVAVKAALLLLPYRVVEARLRPQAATTLRRGRPRDHVRTIWAVEAVGRRLLGRKPCLPQALAARWLLARQDYHTDLRIGVAKCGGQFSAHAWLERDGQVVIGGGTSPTRFRATEPLFCAFVGAAD